MSLFQWHTSGEGATVPWDNGTPQWDKFAVLDKIVEAGILDQGSDWIVEYKKETPQQIHCDSVGSAFARVYSHFGDMLPGKTPEQVVSITSTGGTLWYDIRKCA